MRLLLIIFLATPMLISAQNNYPKDYFSSPLEIPLILSGNFAELRATHFHSGLDIKTKQRTGLNVLASAEGYVSRIKVSHYGYGKALYIAHPNGYTTVYAHLQKLSPDIEAFVKQQQYEKESYEIELFPSKKDLPVTKGSVIAFSGNTGGSGGPHLHFEIRDKAQRPMNPMLFGFDIKDTTPPIVKSVYVYPIGENASVNQSKTKQKLRLTPLNNGDYITQSIQAIGTIGFGVETIDRQDLAANSNGIYNIQTVVNGRRNFELNFDFFSFDETKHINDLIDYEIYKTKRKRIQKLFKKNNPLSIIKPHLNNGFLSIADSTNYVYKIRVSDFKSNDAWVTINIKGTHKAASKTKPRQTTSHFIKADEDTSLKSGNICVDLYKNTFYEDFYMDFEVKNDTLKLHRNIVFAKKNFDLTFDTSNYPEKNKDKLYIARLIDYNTHPIYNTTKRKGNFLTASPKTLGTYTLAIDSITPKIEPANFEAKKWLGRYRYLKIKIDDEESGISNYRATVNGKWILMEYDYKTKTLTHDFNDGVITEAKNKLKVVVTDNVGNNSTFEALFYR